MFTRPIQHWLVNQLNYSKLKRLAVHYLFHNRNKWNAIQILSVYKNFAPEMFSLQFL